MHINFISALQYTLNNKCIEAQLYALISSDDSLYSIWERLNIFTSRFILILHCSFSTICWILGQVGLVSFPGITWLFASHAFHYLYEFTALMSIWYLSWNWLGKVKSLGKMLGVVVCEGPNNIYGINYFHSMWLVSVPWEKLLAHSSACYVLFL